MRCHCKSGGHEQRYVINTAFYFSYLTENRLEPNYLQKILNMLGMFFMLGCVMLLVQIKAAQYFTFACTFP